MHPSAMFGSRTRGIPVLLNLWRNIVLQCVIMESSPSGFYLPSLFYSLENFIQVKDARDELRVYRGEYVRDKLRDALDEMFAEDLDAIFGGELHDSD